MYRPVRIVPINRRSAKDISQPQAWKAFLIVALALCSAEGSAQQVKSPVVGIVKSGFVTATNGSPAEVKTAFGASLASADAFLITQLCCSTGASAGDCFITAKSGNGPMLFLFENQVNVGCYDFNPGLIVPPNQGVFCGCGQINTCSCTVAGVATKAVTP